MVPLFLPVTVIRSLRPSSRGVDEAVQVALSVLLARPPSLVRCFVLAAFPGLGHAGGFDKRLQVGGGPGDKAGFEFHVFLGDDGFRNAALVVLHGLAGRCVFQRCAALDVAAARLSSILDGCVFEGTASLNSTIYRSPLPRIIFSLLSIFHVCPLVVNEKSV